MPTRYFHKKPANRPQLVKSLERAKGAIEARDIKRREERAAEDLGVQGKRWGKRLVSELAALRKKDRRLAEVYRKVAEEVLEQQDLDSMNEIGANGWVLYAWRQAREAMFDKFGLVLRPLIEEHKRRDYQEIIASESFFDMVIYGKLLENILGMARAKGPYAVEIERLVASSVVYRAKVTCSDKEVNVYVKEASLEADMLAARMLKKAGIIVPEMKNVEYEVPGKGTSTYGVMQDICDADGVKNAISLRAFGRDESIADRVLGDFGAFSKKLGCAFETCRMLGIMDMHDRNIFLIETDDGELGIGMIDLGLVACYPDDSQGFHAYAGQLKRVIESIDFADRYGEMVRSEPENIWSAKHHEDKRWTEAYRRIITDEMAEGFVEGALESFYLRPENRKYVWKELRRNDGKPIGFACDEERLRRTISRGRRPLNGKLQELIQEGPDMGKFFLDWSDAWNNGFMLRARINVKAFWEAVLRAAPSGRQTFVY